MLVVLAHREDLVAQALVSRWSQHEACLLTPDDLSQPGWRHWVGGGEGACAVVGGEVVHTREIVAVLTRLEGISEWDLPAIASEERAYVAVEMTAFLVAWLSDLRCRVVNRPTPLSLAGPGWRPERWAQVAARLGIPIDPVRRCSTLLPEGPGTMQPALAPAGATVVVVGDHCFAEVDQALSDASRGLARAAGAEFLGVRFSGPEAGARFVEADLCPDLSVDAVADAALEYLLSRVSARQFVA